MSRPTRLRARTQRLADYRAVLRREIAAAASIDVGKAASHYFKLARWYVRCRKRFIAERNKLCVAAPTRKGRYVGAPQ
jgi:hypothetical protein